MTKRSLYADMYSPESQLSTASAANRAVAEPEQHAPAHPALGERHHPEGQAASTRPATSQPAVRAVVHRLEGQKAEAQHGGESQQPVERVTRGRQVCARVRIGLPREHRFQEAIGAPAVLVHPFSSARHAGSHSLPARVGRDRHRPRGGPRIGRPHHRRGRFPGGHGAGDHRAASPRRACGPAGGRGGLRADRSRNPVQPDGRRGRLARARPAGGAERIGGVDPGRRARGAQLPRPALRRRHAHGALRRRRSRAPARGSSTRARRRRACASSRRRPCARAAAPITASASTTPCS